MADKKFSQFANEPNLSNFDGLAGYQGATNLRISGTDLQSSLDLNSQSGTLSIANGGTGQVAAGVSTVGALLDEGSQVIGDSLVIQDDGAGNSVLATGSVVEVDLPAIQLKISGAGGLSNTNGSMNFRVPYNTEVVNNSDYYTSIVAGGLGTQGEITVLKAGRYYLQARYSTYDLVQGSLPTIDGTKFLRISATVNGALTCVLDNLLVATSVNGEAVATGSGVMDLAANDVVEVTGFHTGATGGTGAQGYPVSSNAFANEPTLWLVKIG